MPRIKTGHELELLRAQALELDKKIKEVAARERARQAANDHRRRLLAGEAALEYMTAQPQSPFAETLLGLLNRRARTAADRALFNLSPLSKSVDGDKEQ